MFALIIFLVCNFYSLLIEYHVYAYFIFLFFISFCSFNLFKRTTIIIFWKYFLIISFWAGSFFILFYYPLNSFMSTYVYMVFLFKRFLKCLIYVYKNWC